MLNIDMVYEAKKVLENIARKTPLIAAPKIDGNVYIKLENLQKTGSFKIRGAFNKISSLKEEERKNGVIACSAGNHAQGVALAASKNNIKSVICIPEGAPLSKIEATKKLGAEVVLVKGVFDDAYEKAMEIRKEKNMTFIHPFNDEKIIAGQATIALEILEDLPKADAVIVPIGGGGLIGGIAFVLKTLKPDIKVLGVEAAGADSMLESRKKHGVTGLSNVSTIADGIAIKKPGDITFSLCEKYVDDIITVNDEETSAAILHLMENEKTVSEGAGAVSVAAYMFNSSLRKFKNAVCVVSGGNIDVNFLSKIITKGLVKSGRITEISTMVTDKPGNLILLLELISKLNVNVISVEHSRENPNAEVGKCFVQLVMETKNMEHSLFLRKTLAEHGYRLY